MDQDSGREEAVAPRPLTLRQLLTSLAGWSVLVVALMYAVGRLLAEVYYREFGLTATSAGLATADLIGQAAGSAVWLVLLSTPALIFTFVALARARRRDVSGNRRPRRSKGQRLTALAIATLITYVIFGVPIGAVVVAGDPSRVGDYGIPVAAIGFGVVTMVASFISHRRAANLPTISEAPGRTGDLSLPDHGPQLIVVSRSISDPVIRRGRFDRIALITYSLVAISGIAVGIAGVLQQARDVKAGAGKPPAPWSLAPSFSQVEVFSSNQSEMPTGECLTEIGRGSGVWVFWDPDDERVWRTNESLQLADCE
jgi:hypothetical protein